MDNKINPVSGDYAGTRTTGLENAALIRLRTPLGTYPFDPTVGSKLHLLPRKYTDPVRALAEQYAYQALQPLLADGRALSLNVSATKKREGWIDLNIEIEQANGNVATFTHPVKVS